MVAERRGPLPPGDVGEGALKVLVAVTGGGADGGAQQVVRALLRGLPDCGVLPVLVTGTEGLLTEESRQLGLKAYVLPDLARSIRPWRDLRALRAVEGVVRVETPQVLHGHSFKAGAMVRSAGRSQHIPAIYTVHGWGAYYELPRPLRHVWLQVERRLSRGSTVAYVCQADRELGARAGMAPGLVIPVGSPVRGEVRMVSRAVEEGPRRLLIVARFAAQKDPLGTVRTLAALRDADPGLHWVATWIGSGPLKDAAVAEAHRLDLGDRVSWVDSTPDISQFYQKAHVLLLLSQYEGTPLSIIEAMRARLIIVATAVGGVQEMLGQNAGVLISKTASTRERVEALLHVLREPAAFAGMRDNAGRESARYDPAAMVREYAALYRHLAHARSSSQAHAYRGSR